MLIYELLSVWYHHKTTFKVHDVWTGNGHDESTPEIAARFLALVFHYIFLIKFKCMQISEGAYTVDPGKSWNLKFKFFSHGIRPISWKVNQMVGACLTHVRFQSIYIIIVYCQTRFSMGQLCCYQIQSDYNLLEIFGTDCYATRLCDFNVRP